MKRLTVSLISVSFIGCSGFESQQVFSSALQAVNEGQKVASSTQPYCQVETVDYELDMHMMSFEMTDSTNVGIGYDLFSGYVKAIGVNVKTESGSMKVKMGLSEALRPQESVVDVMGAGEMSGTEFRFNLDAIQLGLDTSYYYRTPISTLTKKTLASGLKNIQKRLKPIETPWQSRVVDVVPLYQQVIIPAGTVAGLRVGDQFYAYNMNYIWEGEPCESKLVFAHKFPNKPIATLEISQIEKNAALLSIIDNPTDYPVLPGAVLEVAKLPLKKKEKKRSLLRSVRLRNVSSEKLMIENGQSIDVSPYMRQQTETLLNQYGFYPRK